jgi:carbon-monoxide dehydrogenase small subunit
MTGPREVNHVAAGETVPTRMTVNGTPVELSVQARVTLADVLREQLGLTGTHLGCEHGVCGMCTVLIDGSAVRACLLLACQADDAEITTVEGLGSAAELHPLQESFGKHHALQCGFCTPGFLMSSYDLLRHQPSVEAGELPAELSGVICRCTGYRTIVEAVAEVADRYRPGATETDDLSALPPPLNCARRVLIGRSVSQAAGQITGDAGTKADGDARGAASGSRHPDRIILPDTEPTTTVDLNRKVAAPFVDVARILADIPLLATCLPGAELTAELGDDWYQGRARVALGPVKLSFTGVAQVAERGKGRVRLLAQGGDPASGQAQAEISLAIAPEGAGTTLRTNARLYLTGRIASFGRSLSDDVAAHMFDQFATAVGRAASGQRPATRQTSAFHLLAAVLAKRLSNSLSTLFRRNRQP